MRVVIDGRRLTARRTGVGRYLESLLIEWREQFATEAPPWTSAWLAVPDRSVWGSDAFPFPKGCEAEVIGEGWPGLAWEVWGLGRRLRPDDLLFAPANLVPPTWRGRTVLVLHDLIPDVLPSAFSWRTRAWFGWRYRLAARRGDMILAPSEATARDIERVHSISRAKVRVIPPGVGPEFNPDAASTPQALEVRRLLGLEDRPYFLFVGKRSRRRHVPAILEAFASLRAEAPRHRLVFVGDSDRNHGLDLPEGTIIAGHLPDVLMPAVYAQATALLYPSDYEGFGLPIVEAMACGCPAITRRNSALLESAGAAGVFADDARPSTIAQAMRTLINDEGWRLDRRAAGLAQSANFSRSRFAAEVAEALRSFR